MKPPNGCCMLVHHALALSLLVQLKQLVIRSCKIHQSLREKEEESEKWGIFILVPFQTKKHCSTSLRTNDPFILRSKNVKAGIKMVFGGKNPPLLLLFF